MFKPFFTVVIPTFNRANYLKDIFDCLLAQTFKNFEVLICDDGSTDNTSEIVGLYMTKLNLSYFFTKNWGGPAAPRNIGIKNSNSEWICFLDSDDLWNKEKLLILFKSININTNIDVFYHLFSCKENNKINIIGKSGHLNFLKPLPKLLYTGNHIVNSSLCIKKSKLIKVGLVSENKNIIGVEDYELLIRLAENNCNFLLINQVLGEYRINDDNISKNLKNQIFKIKIVLQNYKVKYNDKKIDSLINYYEANYQFQRNNYIKSKRLYCRIIFDESSNYLKIKSVFKFLKLCIH